MTMITITIAIVMIMTIAIPRPSPLKKQTSKQTNKKTDVYAFFIPKPNFLLSFWWLVFFGPLQLFRCSKYDVVPDSDTKSSFIFFFHKTFENFTFFKYNSPHNSWKKFSRENIHGIERSSDKHFTQGTKCYSTSNITFKKPIFPIAISKDHMP